MNTIPISNAFDMDNSLTVNSENEMYSIDHDGEGPEVADTIYLINQNTGVATQVGTTTVSLDFDDQFTSIEFCPEKAIPTLSQWGLILLGLGLMKVGTIALQIRKTRSRAKKAITG